MSKAKHVQPEWRKSTSVRVELDTVRLAEQQVASCEHCTPEDADVPFDFILDTLTGCKPETTDYTLAQFGSCPSCGQSLRPGFYSWYDSEDEGRKLYLLPRTLVTLKK